jgi:hypothetical protein
MILAVTSTSDTLSYTIAIGRYYNFPVSMNIHAINLESSSGTGHKLLQTNSSLLAYMFTQ